MKLIILFISALLLMAASSLCNVAAAENTRVITNEDLKKYGAKDKEDTPVKPEAPAQKTESSRTEQKEPDKQSWCTKATQLRDRIDEAKRKVLEAEKQPGNARAAAGADEKLAQSKQDLETAERELSDFEQMAYSQGIPLGWLRCHFD